MKFLSIYDCLHDPWCQKGTRDHLTDILFVDSNRSSNRSLVHVLAGHDRTHPDVSTCNGLDERRNRLAGLLAAIFRRDDQPNLTPVPSQLGWNVQDSFTGGFVWRERLLSVILRESEQQVSEFSAHYFDLNRIPANNNSIHNCRQKLASQVVWIGIELPRSSPADLNQLSRQDYIVGAISESRCDPVR